MRKLIITLFLSLMLCFVSCNKPSITFGDTNYFPLNDNSEWETVSPESLGWNTAEVPDLYSFLEDSETRALIVLKEGRIVFEEYWGANFENTGAFTRDSRWYWASAGKTLTASLIGIAQGEGLLTISDKTSDHLGAGWTDLPLEKENLVTIKNQLTMTTGFRTNVNLNCYTPQCFKYRVDAGKQWFYHTGTSTVLKSVIENTSGLTYNDFTDQKLETVTGMNGEWIEEDDRNIYWSTARDAARFGLLLSAKGIWRGNRVISGVYMNEMINTSQGINESYGYLTWLNGKSSIVFPGIQTITLRPLSPEAPEDTFAALGKNGQTIAVVPSEDIVVVRFGDEPNQGQLSINYFNDLWEKINKIIN
ncbi:serine hydrolase domain-containing protein [Tenacibaculum jejuense]|uniref:Beta-lactamase n=1 Tax=Tenacibaculum jejuense TaxID=584609 RepID=A0A238UD84_9FLAO|nr:serine hydrolase [Tenacibaculum jejuense]SNR17032.1 Beta-lactamase [Tenacibaculum jejuense]